MPENYYSSVKLNQIPDGLLHVNTPVEAFGAGQGLSALGQGVENAGKAATQIAAEYRDQEERIQVKQAYAGAQDDLSALKAGILARKGLDAKDAPALALEGFAKIKEKYAQGMNERQRSFFDKLADGNGSQLFESAQLHSASQLYDASHAANAGVMAKAVKGIADDAGSLDAIPLHLANLEGAFAEDAKLRGLPPEAARAELDAYRGSALAGAADALLRKQDVSGANAFYGKFKDLLPAGARAELGRKLEGAQLAAASEKAAGDFIAYGLSPAAEAKAFAGLGGIQSPELRQLASQRYAIRLERERASALERQSAETNRWQDAMGGMIANDQADAVPGAVAFLRKQGVLSEADAAQLNEAAYCSGLNRDFAGLGALAPAAQAAAGEALKAKIKRGVELNLLSSETSSLFMERLKDPQRFGDGALDAAYDALNAFELSKRRPEDSAAFHAAFNKVRIGLSPSDGKSVFDKYLALSSKPADLPAATARKQELLDYVGKVYGAPVEAGPSGAGPSSSGGAAIWRRNKPAVQELMKSWVDAHPDATPAEDMAQAMAFLDSVVKARSFKALTDSIGRPSSPQGARSAPLLRPLQVPGSAEPRQSPPGAAPHSRQQEIFDALKRGKRVVRDASGNIDIKD